MLCLDKMNSVLEWIDYETIRHENQDLPSDEEIEEL